MHYKNVFHEKSNNIYLVRQILISIFLYEFGQIYDGLTYARIVFFREYYIALFPLLSKVKSLTTHNVVLLTSAFFPFNLLH